MGARWYRLEGHAAVPVPHWSFDYAAWLDDGANRRVALTRIGEAEVSTVFLGLDRGMRDGDPILFETRVFGGELAGETEGYRTWDEAAAGHAAMCARVRAQHGEGR